MSIIIFSISSFSMFKTSPVILTWLVLCIIIVEVEIYCCCLNNTPMLVVEFKTALYYLKLVEWCPLGWTALWPAYLKLVFTMACSRPSGIARRAKERIISLSCATLLTYFFLAVCGTTFASQLTEHLEQGPLQGGCQSSIPK